MDEVVVDGIARGIGVRGHIMKFGNFVVKMISVIVSYCNKDIVDLSKTHFQVNKSN